MRVTLSSQKSHVSGVSSLSKKNLEILNKATQLKKEQTMEADQAQGFNSYDHREPYRVAVIDNYEAEKAYKSFANVEIRENRN